MSSPEQGVTDLPHSIEATVLDRVRHIVPDYPWLPRGMEQFGIPATAESDVLAPFEVIQYGYDTGDPSRARHFLYPGDLGPVPEDLVAGKIYALRGFVAPNFDDEGARRLQYVTGQPGAGGAFDLSWIPAGLRYIDGQILRYNGNFSVRLYNGHGGKDVNYQAFTLLDKDKNAAVYEEKQRADFATLEGMITVLAGPSS